MKAPKPKALEAPKPKALKPQAVKLTAITMYM